MHREREMVINTQKAKVDTRRMMADDNVSRGCRTNTTHTYGQTDRRTVRETERQTGKEAGESESML